MLHAIAVITCDCFETIKGTMQSTILDNVGEPVMGLNKAVIRSSSAQSWPSTFESISLFEVGKCQYPRDSEALVIYAEH